MELNAEDYKLRLTREEEKLLYIHISTILNIEKNMETTGVYACNSSEKMLWERYWDAKDKLTRSVMQWAVKAILNKKYKNGCTPIDEQDAIGLAGLAISEALNRFDPSKSKFSTYVGWWVRAVVGRHFAQMGYPVHIPDYLSQKYTNTGKGVYKSDYENNLKCVELAKNTVFSLNTVGDDGKPWKEVLSQPDYVEDTLLDARRDMYEKLLLQLDEDERYFITQYYNGRSHADMGAETGYCKDWLRRLKTKLLNKMRASIPEEALQEVCS